MNISEWIDRHKCSVKGCFSFSFDEYALCKSEIDSRFPPFEGWAREVDTDSQTVTIY